MRTLKSISNTNTIGKFYFGNRMFSGSFATEAQNLDVAVHSNDAGQYHPERNTGILNEVCLLEIYPYKNSSDKFPGTGFFISGNCIITAGHNIFNGKWADRVIIYAGANGGDEPYGVYNSQKFFSTTAWTHNKNPNYDFAAIILHENAHLPNYFQCGYITEKSPVEVVGYSLFNNLLQTRSQGVIQSLSNYKIFHTAPTEKGFSGSPVCTYTHHQRLVVGIHCRGSNPNEAIRINPEIYSHIKRWSEFKT